MSATDSGAGVVVEIDELTKRYPGRHAGAPVVAVDHVSLRVRRGEVYGFLGPNGAGKTTTLRMLLGLIRPTSGRVSVFGLDPGDRRVLAGVGSMVEGPAFYPYLSGRDNLTVLARYGRVAAGRVDDVLETVDLTARAADRFSTYSLGMKQRLGVAGALLKDPDLIVLDEPTNGLDPAGVRDMRRLIKELGAHGRTVILSSHMLGEVQQICDRVGVIDVGRMVVENTVEQLRGESELVIAGSPADLVRSTLDLLPAVESVRTVDGELRVRADDATTPDIVRSLVNAGVSVREVRRADRQLEDVFFEITTDHASDPEANNPEANNPEASDPEENHV